MGLGTNDLLDSGEIRRLQRVEIRNPLCPELDFA